MFGTPAAPIMCNEYCVYDSGVGWGGLGDMNYTGGVGVGWIRDSCSSFCCFKYSQ